VRDQLVQAFLNLILNAVDATTRGGRIEIRAERAGDAVEALVRDDGLGVAPENAARLFQPYFTTKKDGTGLGLFVTRKLLADHGGTVECASGPGPGTTFRVRLPAAGGIEPAASTAPGSEDSTRGFSPQDNRQPDAGWSPGFRE
jgi:signal transduction histidine kinase